jgi:hypothetical protein
VRSRCCSEYNFLETSHAKCRIDIRASTTWSRTPHHTTMPIRIQARRPCASLISSHPITRPATLSSRRALTTTPFRSEILGLERQYYKPPAIPQCSFSSTPCCSPRLTDIPRPPREAQSSQNIPLAAVSATAMQIPHHNPLPNTPTPHPRPHRRPHQALLQNQRRSRQSRRYPPRAAEVRRSLRRSVHQHSAAGRRHGHSVAE